MPGEEVVALQPDHHVQLRQKPLILSPPCTAAKALAQSFAPGLGTVSVYVTKGSRRWLFLSTAFAHTCAGPKPGWKLCPHEQREGGGRGKRWRGAQKQRELK